MNLKKENKKHSVWLSESAWTEVESRYRRDNCSTRNEFIEKAIRFYSGYLDAESADAYLPRVLADVLEGKLNAFATHALTSGVDAKTLSGILGHTNASFTLDTYTHVTPDMQQEASHIVGGFLEDLLGEDLKPWQRDRPEGGARHG